MMNKGLINQIPQAVSQAVQPLVEQAANDISSTLGSGNSSPMSSLMSSPMSSPMDYGNLSPMNLSGITTENYGDVSRPPGNNRPIANNGGLIFDQYRQPGNAGRFISPSEMEQRNSMGFSDGGKIDAQNLASKGRGEDKMLVHMTPSEVQGLQALAMAKGGSLTINPETGLPEAGFLSDTFKAVAPTLVGAGLAYFGMPAWAAGLAVGGVEAVRQDDLSAGIMAGLGAYGGAGMANSFTAMGTPPNAAGGLKPGQGGLGLKGSTDFAPIDYSLTSDPIAGSLSGPTAGYERAYGFGADPSNYVDAIQPLQPLNPTYGFDSVGSGTGLQMSDLPPLNEAPMSTEIFKGTADNYIPVENRFIAPESGAQLSPMEATEIMQSGPGNAYPEVGADKLLYRAPPTPNPTLEGVKQTFTGDGGFGRFKDAYVNEMGGNKKALLGAAGVLGSAADGYGAFDPKPFNVVEPEKSTYEGPYFPTERTARFRGMDAILGGEGREFQYFDDVNPVPNVRTATAAHGGLMSTKMAQGGRYLDGPGDGVSDSIPATVDGEQPVLLSEGEYIIPAEVVSAVGNGSSDAGADKFTALVDNIMAKTRRVAKGKPNGADNMLKGLVAQV